MSRGVRPEWWCIVAGLAYGALLTLALPPMDVWWLAFAGPAPLLLAGDYVVRRGITSRRAGLLVALGALPFWFLQTRWLIDVTIAGYPCLAVYQSAYTGLFVALLARVRERTRPAWPLWIVAPPLWVGLELLRGDIALTGYPWFFAAHPLVEAPILASPAAIVGAYGVNVLVVMLAASAVELGCPGGALRPRAWYLRPLAGLLATLALWAGLTAIARTLPESTAGTIRVAVIQTNLPQDNKIGWSLRQRVEDFQGWLRMSIDAGAPDASGRRPDVIVWPETMFPGDALNAEAVEALTAFNLTWPASMLGPTAPGPLRCDEFARALTLVQQDLGIPLVVGALTMDNLRVVRNEGKVSLAWDKKFNSALLIAGGRIDPNRYDKHSLTPFGEAIPYALRVPALQQAVLSLGAGGMAFDLSWGERDGPLEIPLASAAAAGTAGGVRFATPICFEVVRSSLCRRLVHVGDPTLPVLLVNISNDGWFSDWPEGRAQHFQIARWRCIELGVPMVRSVNTGISGAIDAQGRILAKGVPGPGNAGGGTIESHTSGVLTLDVPIARASATPFSKWFGNAAAYGCLGATVFLILASRRGRPPISARPGEPIPARTT